MVERKRHFAKALSYRVFGSAATAAIAYIATGDVRIGASIGVIDSIVKIGAYYVHERIWYRIKWGVKAPSDGHPVGQNTEIAPAKPPQRVVVRPRAVGAPQATPERAA
ncbi:MAG TPA: DUF2061 domain-containing protein [Phycisphaerales bacterium]|jgi:uncharacterized membrane protein|nr:DUF2061 domain-containing protein [Phycisphaerales bacterium]